MAEALGLAASVAGLLSLGLQITSGIASYIDALESRQDELASVKRQNDALTTALDIIRTASSHFQGQKNERAITTNIRSCDAELRAVEKLLADLANCDTSTWRQRLKSQKKKLSYAFNRSKVQQLVQRLHHANEILQLTLTGIGLDVSGTSINKLSLIESATSGHASELLLLRSEVAAAITPVTDIRNQMPLLQSDINATRDLVVSQSALSFNQTQESSESIQAGIRRSHDALQLTLGLHLEKMERIEQLLESQSLEIIARRAASKPAALKELCDSIHTPGRDLSQHVPLDTTLPRGRTRASVAGQKPHLVSTTDRTCICSQPHRVKVHSGIQRGHFHIFGELERQGHWPSCPFSRAQYTRRNRHAVGLKYTGLAHILHSVVGVSLTMTSGAGGFSIGPTFTYYPTVDSRSDPAFGIMDLIRLSLPFYPGDKVTFLTTCIERLSRLFEDKKSSPTAVTLKNESLMHFATLAFLGNTSKNDHDPLMSVAFAQLIKTLLSYGVPAFTYNCTGFSPLWIAHGFCTKRHINVIDVLVNANTEGMSAINDSYTRIHWVKYDELYELYHASHGFAEAFECGPLSMAVICNDLEGTARILNQSPESLSEVDIYDQSPLHLAASKPDILACLARAAEPQILDRKNNGYVTALEFAMMLSSRRCRNGASSRICQNCECAKCVDILIEAGCRLRMERAKELRCCGLYNILEPASELARHHYVSYMKECRTRPEHHGTTSCDITRLTQTRKARSSDNGEILRQMAWVYEEIRDTDMDNLFHRYGFRPDSSYFVRLRYDRFVILATVCAQFYYWLAKHGADLFLKSPTEPPGAENMSGHGLFGAHYAFYVLGITADWMSEHKSPQSRIFDVLSTFKELTPTVIRHNLTDNCECHCSTWGCDPFIWLLKGMLASYPFEGSNFVKDIGGSNSFMTYYYRRCGDELTVLTYEVAIRYLTFEALDIRHTCCDTELIMETPRRPGNYKKPWLEKEEVESINEEQAPILKLHEELVAEFNKEASKFLVNESQGQSRFYMFWTEYWAVRMEQELDKLDGNELTYDERRRAEEIGVRWCEPAATESKAEANPYDKKTSEFWFNELDKICPENREP